MKKIFIITLLLGLLLATVGCSSTEREYLADISIPLENSSAEIVIKEWRYLMGSGAEIYFKEGSELTLLGKTTGADDGYCPFAEGQYTIALEENTLLVRWHFGSDIWKEAHFPVPE